MDTGAWFRKVRWSRVFLHLPLPLDPTKAPCPDCFSSCRLPSSAHGHHPHAASSPSPGGFEQPPDETPCLRMHTATLQSDCSFYNAGGCANSEQDSGARPPSYRHSWPTAWTLGGAFQSLLGSFHYICHCPVYLHVAERVGKV